MINNLILKNFIFSNFNKYLINLFSMFNTITKFKNNFNNLFLIKIIFLNFYLNFFNFNFNNFKYNNIFFLNNILNKKSLYKNLLNFYIIRKNYNKKNNLLKNLILYKKNNINLIYFFYTNIKNNFLFHFIYPINLKKNFFIKFFYIDYTLITIIFNIIIFINYIFKFRLSPFYNFTNIVNFLKLNFNFFKKFFKKINKPYVFYTHFILNNLESLFKNKFYIKFNKENFHKCFDLYLFSTKNEINFKNKKYFLLNFKNIDFFFLLKIIYLSLYYKDLSILITWLIKNVQKLNIFVQKKFFLFLRNFFQKNGENLITYFNIKGFFFDVRGKVGVTGNSKKRHFSFFIGKLFFSSKYVKIDYKQNIIRTETGCLGLTIVLSY